MLAILNTILSHITLNPNFGGESGGYFHTTVRVPHGEAGLHTTGLEIHVPHGVLVAKPEVPEDWTARIEMRTLSEHEQYVSHGMLKTEAPHKIVLEADTHADGVHNDHLLNIDMQLKIGCIFEHESNTKWNSEYTLWWKVDQKCEDDAGNHVTLRWNGTQQDLADGSSPSWSALPSGVKPAPYMYIEPGSRCTIEHSGNEMRGGLLWFGVHDHGDSPPSPSTSTTHEITTLDYISLVCSILGIVLGAIATFLWVVILSIRFCNRRKFTERLIGVEYACKELQITPPS